MSASGGRPDVAFLGPPNVGKTTMAARLAEATGRQHHELDALRRGYFEELGFDMAYNLMLSETQGWAVMQQYWKVFNPHAIERFTADCRGVLDFGGGTPVAEHPTILDRIHAAVQVIPIRILLLPDPDPDRAMQILQSRSSPEMAVSQRYFMTQGSLQRLATHTLYTGHRTQDQVFEEVFALVERSARSDAGTASSSP